MPEFREIGLHTVPSTWVRTDASGLDRHQDTPYRRVVGLRYGSDMLSIDWSRVDLARPASKYNRDDSDLEIITMPDITAERLISFYKRYFVNELQNKPRYSRLDSQYLCEQPEEFNCHRFGYWMRGTPAAQEFECPTAPDHITERRPVKTPLTLGRHAVLGTVGAAVHSVVGLGEAREDCLQVIGTEGHMGIDTYESVVDQYDYLRTAGMQFFT